ncbi:MAG: SMP-30/gluconolactonase/LRE family protein [Actinomycetota bacterium]
MTDLGLVESPRWHDRRLWFSDWIAGQVIAVDGQGRSELMIEHKSLPLCFDFLPDGTPVIVSGPERALLRRTANGSLAAYADLSVVSEYGCNDIVIDGRGNAYVNSPNYNAMAGPPPAGPVAPGRIALVTTDGVARMVADDLAFPNGMAVMPDNATLVVAESYRSRLTAFDIATDGSLSGRRLWADLGSGAPDGICIDAEGAVWYADVPNRHCARVREGGEVAETIELDRGAFACMLGGDAGNTLFIVAAQWPGMAGITADTKWDGEVLSTQVSVPGAGWPARDT